MQWEHYIDCTSGVMTDECQTLTSKIDARFSEQFFGMSPYGSGREWRIQQFETGNHQSDTAL